MRTAPWEAARPSNQNPPGSVGELPKPLLPAGSLGAIRDRATEDARFCEVLYSPINNKEANPPHRNTPPITAMPTKTRFARSIAELLWSTQSWNIRGTFRFPTLSSGDRKAV
jgi:hypothetical protein